MLSRDRLQRRVGAREAAAGEGMPRDETDAVRLAILEQVVVSAARRAVMVLHGCHREYPGGRFDFLDVDFTQTGKADQPLVDEGFYRAELFVTRYLRVDAVQLPQRELFEAEVAQTHFHLLQQVFRSPQRNPFVRPRAHLPDRKSTRLNSSH